MMGKEAMELETDIRRVYADDFSRSLPRPSTLVPLSRPRQTSRSTQCVCVAVSVKQLNFYRSE